MIVAKALGRFASTRSPPRLKLSVVRNAMVTDAAREVQRSLPEAPQPGMMAGSGLTGSRLSSMCCVEDSLQSFFATSRGTGSAGSAVMASALHSLQMFQAQSSPKSLACRGQHSASVFSFFFKTPLAAC